MSDKGDIPMDALKKEITAFAMDEGAEAIGVASVYDLLEAGLPEGRRPWGILPGAQTILSFFLMGIETPRVTRKDNEWIRGTAEHSINFVLLGSGWPGATQADLLAYKIARLLIRRGFKSVPIPSGHPYDKINLRGIISQKHAAVSAGLGEIGLNQLLLTPQCGSQSYPGALLTTAHLEPDSKREARLCPETQKICGLACVKACPVSAIKEDGRFDKKACHKFLYEGIGKEFGYQYYQHILRCGVCMNVCPAGENNVKGFVEGGGGDIDHFP